MTTLPSPTSSSESHGRTKRARLQWALELEERDPQTALGIYRELMGRGKARSTMVFYLKWAIFLSFIPSVIIAVWFAIDTSEGAEDFATSLIPGLFGGLIFCLPTFLVIGVLLGAVVRTSSATGFWIPALAPLGAARCILRQKSPTLLMGVLAHVPSFKVDYLTSHSYALLAAEAGDIHGAYGYMNHARFFNLGGRAADFYIQSLYLTDQVLRELTPRDWPQGQPPLPPPPPPPPPPGIQDPGWGYYDPYR